MGSLLVAGLIDGWLGLSRNVINLLSLPGCSTPIQTPNAYHHRQTSGLNLLRAVFPTCHRDLKTCLWKSESVW